IYGLLAAGLLALTFSRGAWIGLAAGLIVQAVLIRNKDSTQGCQRRKGRFGAKAQRGLLKWLVVAIAAVGLGGIGLLFVKSFGLGERSTTLRTDIYAAAWRMFSEKPLTGYGLFTFGRGLARAQSMPPSEPHSHAHDAPLNIAAETGLIGLAALGFS